MAVEVSRQLDIDDAAAESELIRGGGDIVPP